MTGMDITVHSWMPPHDDSEAAPGTIQPGVWAAILRIPAGEDAGGALAEFRRRLPSYEAWSWMVTP